MQLSLFLTRKYTDADCTACRVWRHLTNGDKTRIFPTWVRAFRLKFYDNGVIPSQNVDTVR